MTFLTFIGQFPILGGLYAATLFTYFGPPIAGRRPEVCCGDYESDERNVCPRRAYAEAAGYLLRVLSTKVGRRKCGA